MREVIEHMMDVQSYPALYGVTQEWANKWTRKDRPAFVIAMTKLGFIRVRGYRHYAAFEYWAMTNDVAHYILNFFEKAGMWDNDTVVLHDFSRRWSSGEMRVEDARRYLETQV